LYIATSLVSDNELEDNKLVERIVDQKLSLDIIVNLLESTPEDQDAMAVLEDVRALKAIFDKININQGEATVVEDPDTQISTIKSESSFRISNRVFTELKTKVVEIRSSYIS
jgi:hypothetical protein